MSPIYIPPTPVPIIRQRIRNQADIQERLRAYDRQQQDLVGANAAAFNATNLGRTNVLYPVVAEPVAEAEGTTEEQEREADPRITEQLIKEKAAEEQPKTPGKGRPRSDMKGRRELIQEIKGAGSIPRGMAVDKMRIEELREMAVRLGIDPLR